MKKWIIGTVLLIGGVLLIPLMLKIGISRHTSVYVGLSVSIIGFLFQMYEAFKSKIDFEREQRKMRLEHEALMREVQELPPEEAIRRLLK